MGLNLPIPISIFPTVANCLACVEQCQQKYPYLTGLLKPYCLASWTRTLQAQASQLDAYLLGKAVVLNLLTISVATGLILATGRDDALLAHYRRLLEKLELYLQVFLNLVASRNFRAKIKNLGGFSFLATLS